MNGEVIGEVDCTGRGWSKPGLNLGGLVASIARVKERNAQLVQRLRRRLGYGGRKGRSALRRLRMLHRRGRIQSIEEATPKRTDG